MKVLVRSLRALVSLGVLLAVVVGLPIALVRWGYWPITGVPSWDQVADLPLTITTDTALFGVLTVAVWIVWAAFITSVAIELVASLRGRPGANLPWCGPLQRSARTLVASLAMSVSAASSLASLPSSGLAYATSAAVVTVGEEPSAPPDRVSVAPETRRVEVATEGPTLEVRQHDTWWGIAEQVLGDGRRWRELRDLNVGRPMPDGQVVTAQTAELLPGSVLVLPAEPAVAARRAASSSAPARRAPGATREVRVVAGDSIWKISERHLSAVLDRPASVAEVAEYCSAFVEENRDRLVHRDNPDLIYPGQVFVLPEVAAEPPTPAATDPAPTSATPHERPSNSVGGPPEPTPSSQPTTTPPRRDGSSSVPRSDPIPQPEPTVAAEHTEPIVTTTPSSTAGTDRESDPGQGPAGDSTVPIAALATVGSTALAVGVVQAIRRRRRRRSHLAPASVPAPSADEGLHRALIATADTDAFAVLCGALVVLARDLADAGQACRPRIVQHGTDHVDVLLDQPTVPPAAGWQAEADGAVWSRALGTINPSSEDEQWMTPAPLLVTLGQPDESGEVYLDLEAAAVTTLTGDDTRRSAVARTIATELAYAPSAETVQILVVGDLGLPKDVDLDRLTLVPDWNTALADLSAWSRQTHEALTASGRPNPFVARAEPLDDDSLVPLLVIATEPPDDPGALAFLHDRPAAAAAVVISDEPLPGSVVVDCQPGRLWLPDLGLICVPEPLDDDQLGGIADLFRAADDTTGDQLTFPVFEPSPSGDDEGGVAGDDGAADEDSYEDPDYDVLVRFLGPITVEGHAGRPLTPQETAAVAFIALRGSVSVDRVEDALWAAPTKGDRRRRLINVMSECRKALGKGHLPNARDGNYTIGPRMMTDVELFDRRVQAASHQRHENAVTTVLGALELCRGPVFDYKDADRDSYAWVEAGDLASHWELKIADVASSLAERCLAEHDPDTAVTACEIARGILPVHTRCTELLMEAHAANGHPHAVDRVYQSHVAALDLIHQDHPAESTVALHHRLRPS